VWVTFARAMMPMMRMPAQMIAEAVSCPADRPLKLLDVAAGHGIFGISFAKRYPNVEVTALDWPQVLEVAEENARNEGVIDRFRKLPGSAFEVEFGEGYDLVLITNFLHHFDPPGCEAFLKKVHAALAPGGRAVTLEFIPNDDRISPPIPAAFSMIMLNTTPGGDAYTFKELDTMLRNSGFANNELVPLTPSPQAIIVSHKE
jgi:ubiquinone/menaquinone biosynthesis C-methylase UbiE